MVQLSVLDLVPVRTGQPTGQAINACLNLAKVADQSSVTRFWLAEHHNMKSVASTSPAVLAGMIAAQTVQMRIGSGGVMLPNHAPLAVAEQFSLLEAAFPGRIDLGIGRAPGTDPVTSWALRGGRDDETSNSCFPENSRFPEWVEQVTALTMGSLPVEIGTRHFELNATPAPISSPTVWLLGSSGYSAALAARMGLPYVYAHHFTGQGTEEALRSYRGSHVGPGRPRPFVTINVCVAPHAEQAWQETLPHQNQMARLRMGLPSRPMETIEEAQASGALLSGNALEKMTEPWLVGNPFEVAQQIFELADRFEVDEVMIHPINGAHDGDPIDANPGREYAVRELASRLVDVS